VSPEETQDIVSALIDNDITAIEIPLNSPDPFHSIEIAVRKAPAGILVGAGTVLTLEAVERLHDVGGRLLVTPNVDPEIIARARACGMVTMPGVFTPTEALLAAKAGASSLKFFPASVLGAAGITAIRAVLPADLMIAAVVAFHAWGVAPDGFKVPESAISFVLSYGGHGVDLFFVISGFIIFYATHRATLTPAEFLRRRVERIVPLYFVVTFAVTFLAMTLPDTFGTHGWYTPRHILKSLA